MDELLIVTMTRRTDAVQNARTPKRRRISEVVRQINKDGKHLEIMEIMEGPDALPMDQEKPARCALTGVRCYQWCARACADIFMHEDIESKRMKPALG